MSETSILPTAATGGQDTGVPVPPGLDDDNGGDDRRRLLIIGGIIGIVVIAIAAYLLLKGGGSSGSDTSTGAVPRGTPAASVSPAATAPASGHGGASGNGSNKAGTVLPKKSKTKLGRNPFVPLVTDDTGGAGTPVSTSTVQPAPTTAPVGVPTSPTAGGGPSESFGAPKAVRLLRVRGDKSAVFDVFYAHKKVFRYDVLAPSSSSPRGTEFAQDFALLGIQGQEVTIQVGDATPFDLRPGATRNI
ncbi:MAG TPA: hypothetical protein VHC43_05830 [Mycobacteriales bacterium]|nr:hypothetical protein [Mycobacteriales bacterium]